MCHEILHFFLFLPIENVKLSLDSWAIGNQKACGVGWRIPMHYPLCISPNNLLKFVSNILMFYSFLFSIPSSKPSTDIFWSLAHQTPPLLTLPLPLPRVQFAIPWIFFIKIYPCQKKLPIAIFFKSYFPELVWSSNVYTLRLSVNTGLAITLRCPLAAVIWV